MHLPGQFILFQFLIGRLRTEDQFNRAQGNIAFQFLIGRLRTPAVVIKKKSGGVVSIPHR